MDKQQLKSLYISQAEMPLPFVSASFLNNKLIVLDITNIYFTAGIHFSEVAAEIRLAPFEQLSCVNLTIFDNHIVGEDGVKSFTVTLFSDYHRVVVNETHASAHIFIQENDGLSKIA